VISKPMGCSGTLFHFKDSFGKNMTSSNQTSTHEPRYDVLWPLSRRAVTVSAAAPRIADLNGKTVCELWDVIFRGEIIYPLVREYIKAKFPRAKFVEYSAFGNLYGPRERAVVAELPEKPRSVG
jgi:hypothetical protein